MTPIVLMASCASEPEVEPQAPLTSDLNLMLSLGTENSGTQGPSSAPMAAPSAGNNGIYYATYRNNRLLDEIYRGGSTFETELNPIFWTNPNTGLPSVAVRLPKENYNSDFDIAAFSVPTKMQLEPEFVSGDFKEKDEAFQISWPKTASPYYWAPANESDPFSVPMAGVKHIDASWLRTNYDDEVHAMSPFSLPKIPMVRAIAKIVIIDYDNILKEVSVKTPETGYLLPNLNDWTGGSEVFINPNVPATNKDHPQNVKEEDAKTNADGKKEYVFYSFERSFMNSDGSVKPADDSSRELITLTAQAGKATPQTTTIKIAPYPLNEAGDLTTRDNGVWRGLLRNHEYRYTVHKAPDPEGSITIEVHTRNWEYKPINVDF